MRPEDFGDLFEQAFEKVQPVDEAHKEKLARMREKFREIKRETSEEIRKVREEMDRYDEEAESMREQGAVQVSIAKEREEIAREAVASMTDTFQEQAALISRIAKFTSEK